MHNLAMRAARLMAICGGLVLVLLIMLICISVVGRSLNGLLHGWIGLALPTVSTWFLQAGVGPINGDFELLDLLDLWLFELSTFKFWLMASL